MKKPLNVQFTYLLIFLITVLILSCRDKTSGENETGKVAFYSMEDFKALPKIDVHVHINTENKNLIKLAKEYNFRLLNVSVDAPLGRIPIKEQVRLRKFHYDQDSSFMGYSTAFSLKGWDEPDWANKVIKQLKEDFDNGANSIKTWKNIGMDARDKNGNLIAIDDPKLDPVFKFIKDEGKVLLTHAGEPLNCWLPLDSMTVKNDRDYFSRNPKYHMYNHPEMPPYEEHIERRDNMLEKNPDLLVIAFHMASLEWSVGELAKFLDRFPKATVDLAERMSHTQYQSQRDLQKVREFFIKYQDRIIYGTDFGESHMTDPRRLVEYMKEVWTNDWKYFNTDETFMVPQLETPVQGLSLPKAVVGKIYYQNAKRMFPDSWN